MTTVGTVSRKDFVSKFSCLERKRQFFS